MVGKQSADCKVPLYINPTQRYDWTRKAQPELRKQNAINMEIHRI
jgi:hypothetical protein